MLVKTEKQKMPFVPNFRAILWLEIFLFHIAIWMWYISEWLLTVSVFLWIAMVIFFYIWKKKTVKIIEKMWQEYEQKSFYNDFNSIQRKRDILKNLSYLKSKFFIFPKEKEINEVIAENDEKIKNLLQDKRNETFAISHISDGLDIEKNAHFIEKISIKFSEYRKDLRRFWMMELAKINNCLEWFSIVILISWMILSLLWGFEYNLKLTAMLFLSGIIIFIFSFFRSRDNESILQKSFKDKEKSFEYVQLLQISAFYHAKLDDFYNFVFHENNFLPETPLLFADIITLLSENFAERKNFLEKYRKLWKNGLKLFFIFPAKIPDEVEKIISEEEINLANEIKNIQNKIREWAEFEKKKITIISAQNKDFFPHLELSNKRQEMLIKNFEKLSR